MTVKINTVDKTSFIVAASLVVDQQLTSQVDTASFQIKKYGGKTFIPEVNDDIEILDGATKIFGGKIVRIKEKIISAAEGLVYECQCTDHTYEFDSKLVSKTYENQTVEDIIDDLITTYAPGFTSVNVQSTFTIQRIVFNQVAPSECLKRLADILQYYWYIDPDKDIHFFPKFSEAAPFNLSDTSDNYIQDSLVRDVDGTQIVNRVKVRGGEYDADLFTDVITVKGNDSKTFKLPYKFNSLTIRLNTGSGYVSKTVGVDFIDTFPAKDVLYNYQDQTIKFENALADNNKIEFSGKPKVPVLAIAEDAASVAVYGIKEKIIRDNTIEDLNTARKRAAAELLAYKEKISDARFSTYTAGLRAGQTINLTSTKRSTDTDFIIRRVRFVPNTRSSFRYDVELVTTKRYGLIELLQKILEPEANQANENEVSEEIRTDTAELYITESIARVNPVTDVATLTISENIQKDPLGAGVEPTWVLAPYFPSSPADIKREGVLDYSMKVY